MLGASTKSFGGLTVRETAELFAGAGLDCAELCFCQKDLSGWRYNLCGSQPLPSVGEVAGAAEIFCGMGVKVCALGLYSCLWSGDGKVNTDSLMYFSDFCSLAEQTGIGLVATHTGTPGLYFSGARIPENIRDRAVESLMYALFEAHKRGVTVAVEFGQNDALCGYRDYLFLKKRTLEYFGTSSMLKYIGVPVNDIDEADYRDAALFHMKDKKRDGRFYECMGSGDGDFTGFFQRLADYPEVPVVLEYVNSSNLAETADKARGEIINYKKRS